MSDFFWWSCPPCSGTGTIITEHLDICQRESTGPFCRERRCECCDGKGLIKLPWGYQLQAVQAVSTINVSGTNLLRVTG